MFSGCGSLATIDIPSDVSSIGASSFYKCYSLASVTVPNNVASIGIDAFALCSGLTNVAIGSGVMSIGASAFSGCTNLLSAAIGKQVNSIGTSAFSDCESLLRMTIPDSVTTIGYGAFGGCTSLSSITLGSGLVSIGDLAFSYCVSLGSITIPDGVTNAGEGMFYSCSNLISVTLGSSVTRIGNITFYNCSSLNSLTIPDHVASIGDSAFCNCSSLHSISIPDSVTSIGQLAFYYCTNLSVLSIGNGLTNIDKEAFYGCYSLAAVTLPDSLTTLGQEAFVGCTNLSSITLGSGLVSIGDSEFLDCWSLTSVIIPNGVTKLGQYTFYACTSLASVTLGISLNSIGDNAFGFCTTLSSITFPRTLTSIGSNAFWECAALTSVSIPNGVTTVEDHTFDGCIHLANLTLGSGTTSIGNYAFNFCWSLTNVTIPDSVGSIGNFAFNWCSGLSTLTIPSGVYTIGQHAFADNGLTYVCFNGNAPLDGGTIFYNDIGLFVIDYVNGTAGWGSTYDGIPTAPCTQCGSPLATVIGQVTCSCDTNPIAGALLTIGGYSATTDSGGNYTISNVPPATYNVTVSAANYLTTNTTVEITSASSTPPDNFALTPSGYNIATLNAVLPRSALLVHKDKNIGTPEKPVWVQASDGTALFATFTPGSGLTIAQAACKLGFNHFNWYQIASADSYKQLLYDCTSANEAYFIDPPHLKCDKRPYCVPVGIACEDADNADPYYNEGSAYVGDFNIIKQVSPDGTVLRFFDQPSLSILFPFDTAYFVTSLIGVKEDGKYDFINNAFFIWDSTFHGFYGGVNIISASMLALTNGTGNIGHIQTNLQPVNIPPDALAKMLANGGAFAVNVQPQTQITVSGANVTFAISPSNTSSPLNYQWRINGTNIGWATNLSLQLTNVTANSTGTYDAILSNANGSIGSAPATLTVLNVPLFQSPVLTTNGQLTLSWIAPQWNNYQLQYTTNLSQGNWVNLGNVITASNTLMSVTTPIGSDQQRFYRVEQQ